VRIQQRIELRVNHRIEFRCPQPFCRNAVIQESTTSSKETTMRIAIHLCHQYRQVPRHRLRLIRPPLQRRPPPKQPPHSRRRHDSPMAGWFVRTQNPHAKRARPTAQAGLCVLSPSCLAGWEEKGSLTTLWHRR
jgi:hypothetical protein